MSLDYLSAPLYSLQDLAQEATDKGAACSSVVDVDSVDIMSIDLISPSATPNKPNKLTFTKFTLPQPMSPLATTTIRTTSVSLPPQTPQFTHFRGIRLHRALAPFHLARRDTFLRWHSTKLQSRTIIHKVTSRSTPKRHDMRRLRTYRPAWYQEKLQRELEESKRSEKLDEERRLELFELWAEFDIMLEILWKVTQEIMMRLAQ
ncbi:hypothetical protein QBC32DRAFT_319387 [Pseudoneurospora amorphoporcata]|uniref:Uncharacterized protein n=1 Tax=Pseudoneurospora amorphoporcata TaxID=241081 RepID=A0AAN6NJH9_9PEZI|nr:hypothetical protein QBC32DRAFT_319387 [Pseudoneurospora amorphoporcata]